MAIVAVTERPAAIREFLAELANESREGITVETSGAGALEQVRSCAPRLVVIDSGPGEYDPLTLVVEIMKLSAMTLTAVVTDMDADEFHDKAEGLGVLKALSPDLTPREGRELAHAFLAVYPA